MAQGVQKERQIYTYNQYIDDERYTRGTTRGLDSGEPMCDRSEQRTTQVADIYATSQDGWG